MFRPQSAYVDWGFFLASERAASHLQSINALRFHAVSHPQPSNSTHSGFSAKRLAASSCLRMLSWLPLTINRWLGAQLGQLAWHMNGSLKRITLINLSLCYPELDKAERERLGKASLMHTGRALTESAWVWLKEPTSLRSRTTIVAGEHLFDEALASDQGLIIATPHMGNWEACNIVITRNQPMTYLYRTPRANWLEPLILKWRANFDAHPAGLNARGLREVLQQLKQGNVIGVLPDQEPDLDGGVFVPLFNQPANSMTLLQKLSNRGQAKVLFCVCERKPAGFLPSGKAGWAVSFMEPPPALYNADPTVAAAAMNTAIEQCIAINPEQYLWSYKRFSLLPEGGRRRYKSLDQ